MLAFIICALAILGILAISEILWRMKILKGENERKFVHISVFTFVAFWPWFLSWRQIQILAVIMLLADVFNRRKKTLHYLGGVTRVDYGDVLMPVTIFVCSLLATDKTFFALAILQTSLADGFAAVIGKNFGQKTRYKVFGQEKTLHGTMTFWLVSLFVFGIGILALHAPLDYTSYARIIIFLPPVLALLENLAVFGLDNIVVPLVALYVLQLAG
jgi:dolichol kinase